jgi:hypothetical protein
MSMSSCATEIEALPGLGHAKNAVRRVLSSGSGVHAVLFYGPQGAGKGRLARLLACSWMCTSPVEGLACGECNVCKSFEAGRAVDFQAIAPWGPSRLLKLGLLRYPNPEDPERPPFVPVFEFFRTRPLMARAKVVLVEDAHRMHSDTANAFLKTLEEPGPTSKVILTTNEFSRVLPTIRSRCMCVACELPPPVQRSPVEAAFGGSPGSTAQVREHAELFQRLYDLLERTHTKPLGGAFKLAEECRAIAEAYAKDSGDNARAANVKVLECVGAWLARERPERHDLLRSVAEAHRRVQGNAQAGIVYEDLFLGLLYHG